MTTIDVSAVRRTLEESLRVKQQLLADAALLEAVATVARTIEGALRAGGKLLFAGNGGSAADAQHLAAEFVSRFEFDRPGLAAIALNTDTSMLTAIANDYGYEHVFARQVEANGRAGDVFVGISTSGNSPNVLRAVEAARRQGLVTIGLCGSGGRLASQCDHALSVPSARTARIQECHICLGHAICEAVEIAIWGERRAAVGG